MSTVICPFAKWLLVVLVPLSLRLAVNKMIQALSRAVFHLAIVQVYEVFMRRDFSVVIVMPSSKLCND